VAGYSNYSSSLEQNIIWDEVTLDKFIADAESVASNTNMIYPGIADAAKRREIIELLKANRVRFSPPTAFTIVRSFCSSRAAAAHLLSRISQPLIDEPLRFVGSRAMVKRGPVQAEVPIA
jgi:hypothetical protein